MDKPTLTFGSLFTGIGGIDLGLERSGMRCAWQVEINDYAIQVLEKRYSNVTRFRDVRSIGRHKTNTHTCYLPITPVDVLTGGFPCQPQSLSGKRRASKDERNLWPEFYRIICEIEPRWIMVENVLGLLSSEKGAFFGGILSDLASSGYDAQWRVFRASDFGYPHERARIFLVAYPNTYGRFRLDPYHAQGRTGLYSTQQTSKKMVLLRDLVAQLEQRWGTPSVCRENDGISAWLDRLGCVGNAVVPDIAEHVARCIMAAEAERQVLA